VFDPEGVSYAHEAQTRNLDVGSYRVGQKVDAVAELAKPFQDLANSYRGAAVLIERLGGDEQHPA
jgi:hypothetical protein